MPKPTLPSLHHSVYEKSLDCVHCGLCLSSCPTYLVTGNENSSPRGRIYLMRGVVEGKIPLGEVVAEEAYRCLACRACETACPSGVEFGAMIETLRETVDREGLRDGWPRRFERFALRYVVVGKWRLKFLVSAIGIAQKLRLDRLMAPVLPPALRSALVTLPAVSPLSARRALPAFTAARGERRGSVAFFVGCVMPEFFPETHRATVRVLAENGYDVVIPKQQGCCGALHAHAGDMGAARKLMAKNVRAFGAMEFDALVVNSAGCGTALREAEHWLPAEAAAMASRVRDVAEFLDDVGLRLPSVDREFRSLRVCYDDPCHLIHSQGVSAQPRRLLRQLPGIELVDHANPDQCCGAAGIYNITHAKMSAEILESKMQALARANPDVIATGNPGCLMQLRRGVAQRGLSCEVLHPIELIDRIYANQK